MAYMYRNPAFVSAAAQASEPVMIRQLSASRQNSPAAAETGPSTKLV